MVCHDVMMKSIQYLHYQHLKDDWFRDKKQVFYLFFDLKLLKRPPE